MAITPGTSSGTYTFALSNAEVVFEAFDRIGKRPPQVDRHMLFSARNSINLLMIEWGNTGKQLWKVISGTINLVAGTATYALQSDLITLLDVYYTQVDANGAGQNSDRIMVPMTEQQYAMVPNKLQPGIPTQYWFQMLATPQITFWQNPSIGAPTYVVNWYGLQRMQDATLGSGQAPDVVSRALDALIAGLAYRLAEKFEPARLKEKKDLYDIAWQNMGTRDQELGPTLIQPNIGVYGQMS